MRAEETGLSLKTVSVIHILAIAGFALMISLVLLPSLFTAVKSIKVDTYYTSPLSRNLIYDPNDYLQVGTKFVLKMIYCYSNSISHHNGYYIDIF